MRRFQLAPMSARFRVLTALLLASPLLLVALSLGGAPLMLPAGGVVLLFVGVWVYSRPTAFELSPGALEIVFPVRVLRRSRDASLAARLVKARDLERELGFCVRIGVGGLWGTFGWLWTSRMGLIDVFVSRTDGLVLVTSPGARPLLITPTDPEELVREISR